MNVFHFFLCYFRLQAVVPEINDVQCMNENDNIAILHRRNWPVLAIGLCQSFVFLLLSKVCGCCSYI